MTSDQLRAKLGIDTNTLNAWIKRGLPCTGNGKIRRFDPAAVQAWLLEQGLAKEKRIARTAKELGDLLGVSSRTIGNYRKDGMPGEVGAWDVDECEAWQREHLRTPAANDAKSQAQAELAQITTAKKRFELARLEGNLLDAGETTRWIRAHVEECKNILQDIPALVYSELPQNLPASVRTRVRDIVASRVRVALEAAARAAEQPTIS